MDTDEHRYEDCAPRPAFTRWVSGRFRNHPCLSVSIRVNNFVSSFNCRIQAEFSELLCTSSRDKKIPRERGIENRPVAMLLAQRVALME